MISVNNLDLRYGDKHLFSNISVQVYGGNRIGLVGVNGSGKSTLLKIMAGISATDDGVVSISKYFTVGYLPQESDDLLSDRSLYDEAETAFTHLLELQKEAITLNEKMGMDDADSPDFKKRLKRLGEIQHQLDASDIYAIRGKIEKILCGLGFSQEDMEKPVSSFSGGWQMRLKLAKMLLEAPSLLLLDEPTNHLDLDSLTWVEQFLSSYQGAMVIISHDRTFLDKITEFIWEISLGSLDVYKGNYTYYLREKAERRAITKSAYDNQQAKIRQTMRFVERFRAKSTKAKQVQSRVKQLEKMERIELDSENRQIRFSFPPAPPSGRDVLQVDNLSKKYDDKPVFTDVEMMLHRGDKVAVVGVNGAGKSTFLKILSEEIKPDSGTVRFGANVVMSYFGQHQARELSPQLTVLETMVLGGEEMTVTRTRSLLGAFLFRGDDVDKKVSVLSGGEKSRLALARMIASPANCMLLDEPTNHLDMSSQEVLQEAMAQYDGTIIVVSHNRYFLDSFVNKVLEVKDGRINLYESNVAEYLQKLEMDRAGEGKDKISGTLVKDAKIDGLGQKDGRKERKRVEAEKRQERSRRAGPWLQKVKEAEKLVEQLEQQKEDLEGRMADPALYSDEKGWAEAGREYDACKRRLERWYDKWEVAQGKVEEIDAELEQS
ncbi:MAG: ABC-F family ATP-binding cassette domain-containing protein [Deltaproteobacteria bacterium]|nr:ABC-F family ATP-binding cassette domain-containing protein [Deltaproteobacteria bacterium]